MFTRYYPHEYVESVFTIDYRKLYDKGYRGVIFDIDNTLVEHGGDSNSEVDALFEEIHRAGLKTVLLSNNDEERTLRFIKNIDTPYVCDAEKPDEKGFLTALEKLGTDKREAVCVGDQVFTDIYGANKCGIDSILVKFIGYYTETKLGIRRRLERIILKFYSMNRSYRGRIGNIEKGE